MMKYSVYFEIYGKKLKAVVEAKSAEEAKYIVMGKIKWHKIEPESQVDFLKNIFNIDAKDNPKR